MPLVIKGSSSGQVTIDVPAAAGTNTITLPASTFTVPTSGGTIVKSSHAEQTAIVTGSGAFQDITGLSASITPASSSNKVLVLAAIGGLNRHSGDTELQLRVTRDGSQVQQTKGLNDGASGFISTAGTAMNELDTPSSTSALTYKIQINNRDANGTVTACANSANSSLVLMEIEG